MIKITREQFLDFIRKENDTDDQLSSSTQHYLDYFDYYQKTEKKGNWNWAALWSPYLFFFRRMYIKGMIIAFFFFLSQFFFTYLNQFINKFASHKFENILELVSSLSLLFLPIIFLMRYTDYIYLQHASQKISQGLLKSGTNKTVSMIIFILMILLEFLFSILS